MTKEQMIKNAYNLMIKNNPDEVIKNLILLDKVKDKLNNVESYIKKNCFDKNNTLTGDLDMFQIIEILNIIKGD